MTKSTPIIDAAIKVAEQVVFDDSVKAGYYAFARILCPKDPPDAWIKAMRIVNVDVGGGWMRQFHLSDKEAVRKWRDQPLWLELWGDET